MGELAWTIGIDLGGTKLDIGMVDMTGKVCHRLLLKTKAKEGPYAVVEDIVGAVKELRDKEKQGKILGMGVGIAGQIEKMTGIVRFAPNLHWHGFPLQEELSRALMLPVSVTNDVRAATWGEWLYGAGRGCSDLLCIFVGTGIGGGVISGGKMLIGCSNAAGEIGHMTIELNGPSCSCGNWGCFEALASGWAIARRVKEEVAKDPIAGQAIVDLAGGKKDELTAVHVFQAALAGDSMAKLITDDVSKALSAGIAGLVNAFNPQRVILGGGIIKGYPEFIELIRRGVSNRALKVVVEPLEIVQASLHGDAGVVGAAAFAMSAYSQEEAK